MGSVTNVKELTASRSGSSSMTCSTACPSRLRWPTDVPDAGMMCDFLWADPEPHTKGWAESERGVSYTFGPDVVEKFLKQHDLDLLVRAHQVVEDGYEFFASRQLVTLFSAPNYCGEFDNAGAIISIDETLMCSFHILKPAVAIDTLSPAQDRRPTGLMGGGPRRPCRRRANASYISRPPKPTLDSLPLIGRAR